ncbi:hypothetical protein SDC9_187713 [bioreactor metagenome]|uniref:NAD-specific glutamate dehydrogenase n=1 Tax=bioreactor metagenome TaxID=1076179 RepID=A0A645HMJ8_9ZZZZ
MNRRIDGGIDLVTACAQLILDCVAICGGVAQPSLFKKVSHNIADCILNEISHVVHLLLFADFSDVYLFGKGGIILFLCDEARLIHSCEHLVGALIGNFHFIALIHVSARVITIRGLRQSRKHGAFANGQLGELLTEIIFRTALNAIVTFAKVNIVKIRFKDRILIDHRLELQREIRFLNLTFVVSLRAKHLVFNELLGDCAAAGGIAVA